MRVRVRVHVRGRLHSLNSTVIDMGVRHCPVNEITSLIQSVHQKKSPPLLQFTWTACFPSTTLHVSGLARVFVHRQNQKRERKKIRRKNFRKVRNTRDSRDNFWRVSRRKASLCWMLSDKLLCPQFSFMLWLKQARKLCAVWEKTKKSPLNKGI